MDWLAKWNAALLNTKCSIEFLTCIRHFSTNDLSIKNKRYVLKTLAVPIIFDPDDATSSEKIGDTSIQNVSPECVDVPEIFNSDDETILQKNDIAPIRNARQNVVPECNCASVQKTIEMQSKEILSQKDKIRRQSNEILKLNRMFQAQSEEVKNLESQLRALTSKLECGLVRFATEAKDSKVRCHFRQSEFEE